MSRGSIVAAGLSLRQIGIHYQRIRNLKVAATSRNGDKKGYMVVIARLDRAIQGKALDSPVEPENDKQTNNRHAKALFVIQGN
jgi:hypothetical protein